MKKLLNIFLITMCIFGIVGCADSIVSSVSGSSFVESIVDSIKETISNSETSSNESSSNETSTSNKENSSTSINQIKWDELNYIAFGDSITFGADYSNSYQQMTTPYPTAVGNMLGLKSVNNQAVSGATYSKHEELYCMSERILRTTTEADIISVMLGVNDYTRSQPLGKMGDNDLTTIYGAINKTMEHLTTNYPNAYIFYMTPYKIASNSYYWQNKNEQGYYLIDVCNAIKETAELYNIDVLDMFEYGNYEEEMHDADSDGIHPNQDFVLSYTAPQIVQFIKKNYK